MNQLKLWKSDDSNRSYGFLYSRPRMDMISDIRDRPWMCTLTIHDGNKRYSYTGLTSLFVGTKQNTKYMAKDMAISGFSSDTDHYFDFSLPSIPSIPSMRSISPCRCCQEEPLSPKKSPLRKLSIGERLRRSLDSGADEEDPGVDDVKIIKRTPSEEKRFISKLDEELEEYMKNYPQDSDEEDPFARYNW